MTAEATGFKGRVPGTEPYTRNSAFWLTSSFCKLLTSSFLGGTPVVATSAAAHPDAWPTAMAGAMDRAD